MGDQHSRQSFLGKNLDHIFENCLIGIIGLGGGGSQVVQQLAHIGFKRYVLCDYDQIESTNLNRLVGATQLDVELKTSKMAIAVRHIRGIQPNAFISSICGKWQENTDEFKSCDIIFGCLDGYQNRAELESLARRSLIPYIDIGMDVKKVPGEPPRMSGQVIASIPGFPCMRCYDFLNETVLAQETKTYGHAGIRPQVIWPNAMLAATAVSIAMNLLTNWTEKCKDQTIYYEYDGNRGTMKPHLKSEMPLKPCPHYKLGNIGDIHY